MKKLLIGVLVVATLVVVAGCIPNAPPPKPKTSAVVPVTNLTQMGTAIQNLNQSILSMQAGMVTASNSEAVTQGKIAELKTELDAIQKQQAAIQTQQSLMEQQILSIMAKVGAK